MLQPMQALYRPRACHVHNYPSVNLRSRYDVFVMLCMLLQAVLRDLVLSRKGVERAETAHEFFIKGVSFEGRQVSIMWRSFIYCEGREGSTVCEMFAVMHMDTLTSVGL